MIMNVAAATVAPMSEDLTTQVNLKFAIGEFPP
jgi:hypothetical protein